MQRRIAEAIVTQTSPNIKSRSTSALNYTGELHAALLGISKKTVSDLDGLFQESSMTVREAVNSLNRGYGINFLNYSFERNFFATKKLATCNFLLYFYIFILNVRILFNLINIFNLKIICFVEKSMKPCFRP